MTDSIDPLDDIPWPPNQGDLENAELNARNRELCLENTRLVAVPQSARSSASAASSWAMRGWTTLSTFKAIRRAPSASARDRHEPGWRTARWCPPGKSRSCLVEATDSGNGALPRSSSEC
jgi:hypothetical protein